MTKQAFHARIWSKLVAHNRRFDLVRAGDRVLAAVSGGPDSTCLAHFLRRLADRVPFELRLVHFHHGLRGRAADRDADGATRLARDLGLTLETRSLPVAGIARRERRSLEDAGRALRYRALAGLAARLSCGKVATGHHMDDQAETLLLHLLRGTRARGLAGIPVRRPLAGGVEVIRPLLCLSRGEILEYLRRHRLSYRRDASNSDPRFTRNWIRSRVLPMMARRSPRVREHLAQVASDMAALLESRAGS